MPIAKILLIQGRTPEQKRTVIEKVTTALVEALDMPRETVRVLIHEIPGENWGIAGVPTKDGV